jgi:hypothetical protein
MKTYITSYKIYEYEKKMYNKRENYSYTHRTSHSHTVLNINIF